MGREGHSQQLVTTGNTSGGCSPSWGCGSHMDCGPYPVELWSVNGQGKTLLSGDGASIDPAFPFWHGHDAAEVAGKVEPVT
jgi:hypothetical protein